MPENIVAGLFGLTPQQIQQQRLQEARAQAFQAAQLDPFQRANFNMQQGAGMLAGAGAQALGMQDPAVVEAQKRQALLSQLKSGSPEDLLRMAELARSQGDTRSQLIFQKMAADRQSQLAEDEYKKARAAELMAEANRSEDPYKNVEPYIQSIRTSGLPPEKIQELESEYYQSKGKPISEKGQFHFEKNDDGTVTVFENGKPTGVYPGTGKASKKGKETEKTLDYISAKFDEVQNAMADTLGIDPGNLENALSEEGIKKAGQTLDWAVGNWQQYAPDLLQTQEQVDMRKHIERLQSLAETMSIGDLRAAGVAPGSITEKEWKKFRADLGTIDIGMGGPALAKQFARIYARSKRVMDMIQEEVSNQVDGSGTGDIAPVKIWNSKAGRWETK